MSNSDNIALSEYLSLSSEERDVGIEHRHRITRSPDRYGDDICEERTRRIKASYAGKISDL
jgi:hypothetical protein